MKRYITMAIMFALLSGAAPVSAAYTFQHGQTFTMTSAGTAATLVNIKSAVVQEGGTNWLRVQLFGLSYRIDTSGGYHAGITDFPVGTQLDMTGDLDATNPGLIHALWIKITGAAGNGIFLTPPVIPPITSSPSPSTLPPSDNPGGTSGSTTGICATGGQVAGGSGGFETIYGNRVVNVTRLALGCYSVWDFQMPDGGGPPGGTTLNHKFLWFVWYYGAAMYAGSDAQKKDARDKLIKYIDDQAVYGQYSIPAGTTEVLNTSHYQIWSRAAAAARLLAFIYKDQAVLNSTGRWWRAEKALWDELQHGGSIRSPGARSNDGNGTNPLRDVNYALLTGRSLPGNAGQSSGPWWDNYYNVPAWMIRILLDRGDDMGGAKNADRGDVPILPYPMCIYTRGSDYVNYFPKMPQTLDPLYWVADIGGVRTQSSISTSLPPALAGASLRVLPGKNGSNSDCPATL